MQQLAIGGVWHARNELTIPSFPWRAGWRIVSFLQSQRHPRDAIVMCARREAGAGDEIDYVVWTANTVEGGCHNGSYFSDFDAAWVEFQRRIGNLS